MYPNVWGNQYGGGGATATSPGSAGWSNGASPAGTAGAQYFGGGGGYRTGGGMGGNGCYGGGGGSWNGGGGGSSCIVDASHCSLYAMQGGVQYSDGMMVVEYLYRNPSAPYPPSSTGTSGGPLDTNWVITSTPTGSALYFPYINAQPCGWVAGSPAANWISPVGSCGGTSPGYFTYRTTFQFAAESPLPISLNFTAATDDNLYQVILNGVVVLSSNGSTYLNEYNTMNEYIISGPFQVSNVLELVVFNFGDYDNPSGLYVLMGNFVYPPYFRYSFQQKGVCESSNRYNLICTDQFVYDISEAVINSATNTPITFTTSQASDFYNQTYRDIFNYVWSVPSFTSGPSEPDVAFQEGYSLGHIDNDSWKVGTYGVDQFAIRFETIGGTQDLCGGSSYVARKATIFLVCNPEVSLSAGTALVLGGESSVCNCKLFFVIPLHFHNCNLCSCLIHILFRCACCRICRNM